MPKLDVGTFLDNDHTLHYPYLVICHAYIIFYLLIIVDDVLKAKSQHQYVSKYVNICPKWFIFTKYTCLVFSPCFICTVLHKVVAG